MSLGFPCTWCACVEVDILGRTETMSRALDNTEKLNSCVPEIKGKERLMELIGVIVFYVPGLGKWLAQRYRMSDRSEGNSFISTDPNCDRPQRAAKINGNNKKLTHTWENPANKHAKQNLPNLISGLKNPCALSLCFQCLGKVGGSSAGLFKTQQQGPHQSSNVIPAVSLSRI